MRLPRPPWVLLAAGAALTLLVGLRAAAAEDAPPKGAKPSKPSTEKAPPTKAEQIAWRPQWTEAVEEAAERNVLVMIHSHGST